MILVFCILYIQFSTVTGSHICFYIYIFDNNSFSNLIAYTMLNSGDVRGWLIVSSLKMYHQFHITYNIADSSITASTTRHLVFLVKTSLLYYSKCNSNARFCCVTQEATNVYLSHQPPAQIEYWTTEGSLHTLRFSCPLSQPTLIQVASFNAIYYNMCSSIWNNKQLFSTYAVVGYYPGSITRYRSSSV